MTPSLHDIIVDRTPLEKSIRVETLRIELSDLGYSVVSTDWLRRLNKEILKRKLEEA